MANLLIRNLDDDVLKQLKAAAKAHGRPLQAEIHEVLRNACARRLAETRREILEVKAALDAERAGCVRGARRLAFRAAGDRLHLSFGLGAGRVRDGHA